MEIDFPSLGRVVHFTDAERRPRFGWVEKYREEQVGNEGRIDLAYFNGTSFTTLQNVPHSADGIANSWRYPRREERKLRVER